MAVTLAYVTDAVSVSHVTPTKEHQGGRVTYKLRRADSTTSDTCASEEDSSLSLSLTLSMRFLRPDQVLGTELQGVYPSPDRSA